MSAEPRFRNPVPTIVHDVVSSVTGETYRLFVSLPKGYAASKEAYPLLVMVDGNGFFNLLRELVELHQGAERVPELIIVGIGYVQDIFLDALSLRGRDMTFFELTAEEKAADSYPFEETGGGQRFLEAVKTELLPFIETTYRVNTNDRALVGYSMGGDFALYSLFYEPDLFRRVGALSPYIIYREGGIPAAEEAYAATHMVLPVRLFVGREGQSPMLCRFMDTVKARHYSGLELDFVLYEDEEHSTVAPIALMHGLGKLYR